jgi:hypothetical protein
MGKSIKKIVKYVLIIIGIILAIPTLLYFVLQIPSIQTSVVKRIAGSLSEKLQANISIDRVEYRFFNRLSLSNVLFRDMNNDTLLYSAELTAGIRRMDLKRKHFHLGRVNLEKSVFDIITDTAGRNNLSWYLDKLSGSKSDTTSSKLILLIDRIDLAESSFHLVDKNSEKVEGKVIDFKDLELNNIKGNLEDFSIDNDTITFNAYNLSFAEKRGLSVSNMSSFVTISGPYILLRSVHIPAGLSNLNFNQVELKGDSAKGFGNFVTSVNLDIQIDESVINSGDIGYFVKMPEDMDESLILSGDIKGTISELRGRNINIRYGDYTVLDCDLNISGLPDFNNAFLYVGVNSLVKNAKDIEKVRIPGGKKIIVPEILYKLGDLSFNGSFSGFITDFVTYGEFSTNMGDLSTDLSLRPEGKNVYKIKGLISGGGIALGKLTDSENIGKLSLHANIDGYTSSLKDFTGSLKGTIDSIDFNDYKYRNIELNGSFTEKKWDGSIRIADENVRLDLLGLLDFNNKLPEFNFSLDLARADLHKLNFNKIDSTSSLSMQMAANFRGNNIDNLDGEIKLLSSTIIRKGKTMNLKDFTIRTFVENTTPVLSMRTDFVNADIKGKYNFTGIRELVRTTLASLMPSLSETYRESENKNANNFTFEINFMNTDRINDFFGTGIILAENSFLKGSVTPENIAIDGNTPSISIQSILFSNLNFNLNEADSVLKSDIKISSVILPGNTELKNFSIGAETRPDHFLIKTEWDNNEEILNEGSLIFRGSLSEGNSDGNKPIIKIAIDSSTVYVANKLWKVAGSSVEIDTNAISIHNIHIAGNGRFYDINGKLSEETSDTLHLQFRGIDISPLNYLGKSKTVNDSTKLKTDLRGQLNGVISLTDIYKNPVLIGDIVVNDFSLLGSGYGNFYLKSEYDNSRKLINIRAHNESDGKQMIDLTGSYDPESKRVFADVNANSFPSTILNPLLRSFASEINGNATGNLKLTGTTDDFVVNGALKTDNLKIRINYLQTVYTVNDSIRFNRDGISFNNVRFNDEEGHQATINGTVFHKNFKNFTADLTVNMNNDFLALNTNSKNNPMFYGKVYGSGVVKIKADPQLLSFDISAATGRNTLFHIPLTDEMSVSEYSFITFKSGTNDTKNFPTPPPAQTGINLNIDLTVTPDAVIDLIFDKTVGDKITGSGSGVLNITLDPNGNFGITGDYLIERGDYLFTLGNILNKKFEVENGGRITFNGNLDNAEIELRAIYQKFNTSLYPVLMDEAHKNERIAVEPQLLLTGELFNPTVKFEINLPNSDEETKTYLKNAIATDEEMSRQFMYLLVMNSFYSEQSAASNSTTTTGTTAMAATTIEMVSNQLSNWISQINKDFNLGFSYRPGSGNNKVDPNELQVAFETQVLNDKVVLNGNFDYRTTTSGTTTNQLTGDFDAELRLTNKFRLRVFNRFNDTYTGLQGQYTQGIGIFYKEDFEKLRDLFRKRNKQAMKKEDEVNFEENKK